MILRRLNADGREGAKEYFSRCQFRLLSDMNSMAYPAQIKCYNKRMANSFLVDMNFQGESGQLVALLIVV